MTSTVIKDAKSRTPTSLRGLIKPVVRAWGRGTSGTRQLPQFLLLGTKRGGTTTLWNALVRHPDVLPLYPAVQTLKSAHYYCENHERGLDWYRSFFASDFTRRRIERRDSAPTVAGESCPYYMYDPRIPALVARDLPDIKLLIVLRDPVERAYSHYKERLRAGVERLSFPEALAVEDERMSGELGRMAADPFYYSKAHDYYTYRDRGVYLPQLQRWQELFPASQLHIEASEDFYDQPQATYDRIIDFLGLPQYTVKNMKRFNYHAAAGMDEECRLRLREFYREHNEHLFDHLGRRLPWAT